MRKSLRIKIVLILSLFVILIIFSFWLINNIFLEKYHIYIEQKTMKEAFFKIEKQLRNNPSSLDSVLEKYKMDDNLSILITNSDFSTIYSYLEGNILETFIERIQQSGNPFPNGKIVNELYRSDKFTISKVHETRLNSYYFDLFGRANTGYIIYIRTPFSAIQQNTDISNRLLSMISIGLMFASAIIAYVLSKQISKPIVEMSEIARNMAMLNFSRKYETNSKDEIGILGNSLNLLSSELERNIRDLQTANKQLQQDINKRIEIDEMRKEFLSNVSHELKTPIALVLGYAEGLKDNIIEDESSKEFYCDVIIDEAEKMNKMVKKILTLNQIEFGHNQLEFEEFDMVSLIDTVIKRNDIHLSQNGIHAIFDHHPVINIVADAYMMEEVITNYLTNAINHISGDKTIIIKSFQTENNTLRVSVFNTGNHIPEEDLEKIWIKFYKVDKARTREYGGSGIGLSIVKAIITLHNGQCGAINVENGVEFWFEI